MTAKTYLEQLEILDTKINQKQLSHPPMNRILSFTAMEESRFMQQYKGNAHTTSKSGI